MGANDVSNAFDASWGNEIVSVTAIFGAIFVGFASTNTVRRNIVDLKQFETDPYELMLGQIAILVGRQHFMDSDCDIHEIASFPQ
ncbi:hypothetical protein WR25_15984 [Diploscapter pachys]|uniref:Uncharacterized protein n=1 Tax=Diploscapter pachys TaxID=2018661 RepID=A0A2A2M0R1_9BILA|nr:hypothetical protein WR25_15984 [Diploscapter pachys]